MPVIKKKVLTLQALKDMKPGTVIAKGEAWDIPGDLYMSTSGKKLRWMAVRGDIHDWAIYCHFAESSWDFVRSNGDKVCQEIHIKRLVPCDDEAFRMYRY